MRRFRTPDASTLQGVLIAPPRGDLALDLRLAETLAARLSQASRAVGRVRLDAYAAERGDVSSSAFSWSARTARRALGTAAVRAALPRGADPLTAAHDEVERRCDRARRGLARPTSLDAWLNSVPRGVRAICALEGASWATTLLSIADTAGRAGLSVGVTDAWYEVPGALVTLRGRRDAIADAGPRTVLRCRDGAPGDAAVVGLAVDGLVDAIATSGGALPARVVGVWPDAGLFLCLEMGADAARCAARALVTAATAVPEPCRAELEGAAAA